MIRIVLLDMGNVLVKVDFKKFAELAATESLRSPKAVIERYDRGDARKRLEAGEISEAEFFEDMRQWLGRPKSHLPHLKRAWTSIFSPLPGGDTAIDLLRESCLVWILSDTNPLHLRFLRRNYPFLKRAHRFFASYRIGAIKEKRKPFEHVIRGAQCDPQEIFFVDDLEKHVATATTVGLNGMVFKNWKETLAEIKSKMENKKPQREKRDMATKKKAVKKTTAKKSARKTAAGSGTITYTTSNVFNAPVAKVWAAATEKKHLKKHYVDDMRGEYKKGQKIGWFWKEWGWMDVEVVSYKKNKELTVKSPFMMGGNYIVTTRYEILKRKEDGKTVFRIHESGYPKKDLKVAFMMCEGWSEFHTGIKAYLMGVDLRKA